MKTRRFVLLVFVLCTNASLLSAAPRWWKGNLHTHTFWSDGDDFPEMVIDWYKTNGYQFLSLSDHNAFQDQRVAKALTNRAVAAAFPQYLQRFGAGWVEQSESNGQRVVWLKKFDDFRPLFEESNRFLLIRSEEITDKSPPKIPVHLIGSNLREFVKPRGGSNVLEVMQRNMDAVHEQRQRTGVPMIAHVAHPNFEWALKAEDLVQLKGDRFFEVYNGHADVRNKGDKYHVSTERMWDIINTQKLVERREPAMFGVAVDDSHHYQTNSFRHSNPGRGWVEVRAAQLTPASIILALEEGNFYASSGVKLRDVRLSGNRLSVEIEPEWDVTFTTQFIGTRRGYDPSSRPVLDNEGEPMEVTRVYGKDIGVVLAEVGGPKPSYMFKGDELYVRAKVISSKLKPNAVVKGEQECAWTQPVGNPSRRQRN